MNVSPKRATRRLTRRIIAAHPGQLILIATICLVAIATGIATHHVARAQARALEQEAVRRWGAVSITIRPTGGDSADAVEPASSPAPASPAVSHSPAGARRWITQPLLDEIRDAVRPLDLSFVRRIEGAAYGGDGVIRRFIAIGSDDPAWRAVTANHGDGGAADSGAAAGNLGAPHAPGATTSHVVAVRSAKDAPVEWREIPPEATLLVETDELVWVRRSWIERTVTDPSLPSGEAADGTAVGSSGGRDRVEPVANVLVLRSEVENPFSTAYEVNELVGAIAAGITARAWPQLVGYGRYAGTGGAAGLLRPLALAVAAVAIAGSVAVAMRNRTRDTVLLRTLGFDIGVIRAVYVREVLLASLGAALIAVAGMWIAARLGTPVSAEAAIRRTVLGAALLPPLVAFLTVRRQLRAPLARVRREADR